MEILLPPGWPRPSGYSNGIAASGRMVFVAGQIGWQPDGTFASDDLAEQFRQTLVNTLEVLQAGGARPEHIVRMTWYLTDKKEYLQKSRLIGEIYRDVIGRHYPAMAVVVVKELIEDRAKVEVETTAVVPK